MGSRSLGASKQNLDCQKSPLECLETSTEKSYCKVIFTLCKINLNPHNQNMKIDITHNTTSELMLRAINDRELSTLVERSFEEYDLGIIKRQLMRTFTYTGEQMIAFEEEWKLSYADWYWENCPAE